MNNTVPELPGPTLNWENKFVCEACCNNGVVEAHNGCVIFHCPDHMTLCIKDGEVLSFQSHGIRH